MKHQEQSINNQGHNSLSQAIKTATKSFYFVIFFGFIASFLTIATSIYSLEVFDRVLSSGSLATLGVLTLIIVIFAIILHFIQAIRMAVLADIAEFWDDKLSSLVISSSFLALKKDISQAPPSRNIKDLNIIKNFISGNNFITAIDAPWSLIFIGVIFLIHHILGFVVVFAAILLFLMALVNDFLTKKLSAKISEINIFLNKDLEVMERNVEAVEAMQLKQNLIDNWQKENKKLQKLQHQLMHRVNIIANLTKMFRALIYIAAIAIGAILVIDNQMSSGGIIACSILSAKALLPFDAAINIWNNFLSAKRSYLRLDKLITENPLPKDGIKLPTPQGNVMIEKLAFTLPKSKKPIIKGINIAIKAGEIIAIIGPTASGKSTLAKLICGIYEPSSGAVRLDGADIRNCNKEDLGEYIGYLPQDIELFNGSVKSNIAKMKKDFKDEDVLKAAQIADAHQMILKLSKGYETDIGLWGSKISAGQRQRIALARAFYGNPKLVILDEPNSNLDSAGEKALANCLANAKKQKITTIIISHRQQILQDVDKVLVLIDGTAKAFGDREEIINKMSGK